MSSLPDNTNKILAKISVAAKTALASSHRVELARYIGTGPSIRARARLALALAFLTAVPTLFIGVMRTDNVFQHAASLTEHDDYLKQILGVRIAIKDVDLALWSYLSEREFENGQSALMASEFLGQSIAKLVREHPADVDIGPPGFLEGLVRRLHALIERAVANKSSIAPARLSIITIYKELSLVEKRVLEVAERDRIAALSSLATVGRDQLILFLILLFAIPIFVGFLPGWVVAPLSRLRQIASKIELAKLKEMTISGKDEVAILARTLKTYLLQQEEVDYKKSSKIFEMRNILRSVLGRVREPVFIVDDHFRINYTNEAAAMLVGLPCHQMEGKGIADCMFCPVVKKGVENAFAGDVSKEHVPINIEVADGRIFTRQASIGVVRNREGEVSRAVIVLHDFEVPNEDYLEETFADSR